MSLKASSCLKYILLLLEVKYLVGENLLPLLRDSPEYVKEIARTKTVKELIEYYGYPAETYDLQTEDGYILQLDRMPNPKGKPVLIVHGIQATAATWLLLGPKCDLPFLLHDQGYDVWLANTRGNEFSRRHVSLNPDNQPKFWNFSWHETGYYDLPAFIDFILLKTEQEKLSYIGHSQGSTAFFVLTSLKPEYNAKVSFMHAMSPAVYFTYAKSIVFRVAPLLPLLFRYPFLKELSFPYLGVANVCLISKDLQKFCNTILASIFGDDFDNLDQRMVPVFFLKLFDIASLRQYVHFLQIQKTGVFAPFDEGYWLGNALHTSPYPLEKVSVPIALYYGKNDYIVSIRDVKRLKKELRTVVEDHLVPLKRWNHVDPIIGLGVRETLYTHILKVQKRYEKENK